MSATSRSPRRRRRSASACSSAGWDSSPRDLDRVYLAGGFANAIDTQSAFDIGLLVPVPAERVVRVGNASIGGARTLLLARRRRAELEALVRRIEHVELESEPDFFDLFTDGCLFEPIAI